MNRSNHIETAGDVAVLLIGMANDLMQQRLDREPTLPELTDCLAIAYDTSCGLMGAGGATADMIEAATRLDDRLRTVEKGAALTGAVTGGVMAVAVGLIQGMLGKGS